MIVDISYAENERLHYFIRFFYDLLFWILINIIILNMVFGIIIDSFACIYSITIALRDEKNKLQKDMQNNCFICGLPRTTFDNVPNGFTSHKQKEHNIWNYLFFFYNVRFKGIDRLMGIELYVAEMKNENSVSWIPLMRSGRVVESSERILDERLKTFHSKLLQVRKTLEISVN